LPAWDVAVLFSGNKLEIYTVHRDMEVEANIIQAADWFWHYHVEPKVPPPIDGSESCGRYLAKRYALGNQTFIESPPDNALMAAYALIRWQKEIKELEASEQSAKNFIADAIGENKGFYLPDHSRVQWVRPKPSEETDWKGLATDLLSHHADEKAAKQWLASYTREKPNTPYIRFFDAPANVRKLEGV
jgi:predicted phage-related endonuclease